MFVVTMLLDIFMYQITQYTESYSYIKYSYRLLTQKQTRQTDNMYTVDGRWKVLCSKNQISLITAVLLSTFSWLVFRQKKKNCRKHFTLELIRSTRDQSNSIYLTAWDRLRQSRVIWSVAHLLFKSCTFKTFL